MPDTTATKNKFEAVLSASLLPALTIGVPFCIFKYIFGIMALRIGTNDHLWIMVILGYAIIIWASIDLFMNLMRVLWYFSKREPPIEFCLIAQFGRLFRRPRFFLTVDTFLSFFIICFFLWSGWITHLTRSESYFWYAATTVNLISLSILNIVSEFKQERAES